MITPAHVPRPASIVLVISSLGGGGAERVMALLAGEWVRRGRRVALITLAETSDAYPLPPEVLRIRLGLTGASTGKWDALRRNWRRLRALRHAILQQNPAVVISFMDSTNVLTLLAMRRTAIPVIVSERIDPRQYPIPKGWQFLRRHLYPRAKSVVVQTASVARWAHSFLSPSQVAIIPNPVLIPVEAPLPDPPQWLPPGRFIAAMGRLDPQKGFDLLIRAFAALASQFPDLSLIIMGEGPSRAALETLTSELNLTSRIQMPSRIDNASPILARCEIFVMSSRFEGFPNALLEAMAIGAPVISTDCPSGPGEIIRDGENGLLISAEDVPALQHAITHLLLDAPLRQHLSQNARESVQRYALGPITDSWEHLFATT